MSVAAEQSKRIPLGKALRQFFDEPPHMSTAIRWCMTGVLSPRGERVKLRSERVGGRRYVFAEDVQAFIASLNPPEDSDSPAATDAEDADRRGRDADDALKSLGY